jgi:hypothetical protein
LLLSITGIDEALKLSTKYAMKKLIRLMTLAVAAAALGLGGSNLFAQDAPAAPPPGGGPGPGGPGGPGGNFDPAQMRQQIADRMSAFLRDKLAVTNDDEWAVIQPKVSKVTQIRMQVAFAGMGGFRGMMGGNRGGGNRFGGMMQSNPEQDALQQALDSNAPKDQVKAALENLRAARKRQKDDLAKAQDELREMLTLRQEATLVSLGILD